MAAKTRDHLTDQLFKAILSLKSEEQCSNFFEDICTISELKSMAQRLEVARMLDAGCIYEEIVEKTGASTATISRVKRCLVYGADGYNSIMPLLRKTSTMLNNKALQVPYGTRDVLPGEAGARRIIENKLASTFKAWGYDEVVTPTFEYLDTFAAAGQLSDSSFKFFDRRNNILLLRSDMTTPLARLVATRLNEGPAVKRLFYLANLFRYEETQAGRQCEFNQAGVEMMGAAGPSADAEMLALAVASLQAAGLNDFVISVGQIDFINGLIEAAEVTELQAQELKRCLIEHDVVRLEALADGSRMSPEQKDLFKELPFLHGGLELLDKVEACGLNNKSSKAVQDLREIYALAEVYGAAGYLRFDLGLLRDLDYYTGMLFEGYAEDMGFPIIGGGRYDTMMENFGRSCPATGFAIGIDRIMLILSRRRQLDNISSWDVLVAWQAGCLPQAIAQCMRLRRSGKTVKLAAEPFNQSEAVDAQRANACDTLLYIED